MAQECHNVLNLLASNSHHQMYNVFHPMPAKISLKAKHHTEKKIDPVLVATKGSTQ